MENKKAKAGTLDACSQEETLAQHVQILAESELVESMIYQIRTLSNAVIGFCDLLFTEPLSREQSDYVHEIYNAGQGLSVLVSDVLDWTQLLSGKLQAAHARCSLQGIAAELEKRLSTAALEKGLHYELIIDPQVPAYIMTDEQRLLKCLVSLIANAIEHTCEGSVRVHITLETNTNGPCVRYDIIDDGVGISPENTARLFEITQRSLKINENALSSACTGLTVRTRLPLINLVCNLLGGTLEVESQVNVGSVFSLRIPVGLDLGSAGKLPPSVQPNVSTADSLDKVRGGCVLLVEDQQSNRIVISLMLEALGIEVDTAENGREALEKFDSYKHQLILMDLKMPKMDGYEATRLLHEQGCPVPIVAMSAKVLNQSEHDQIMGLFNEFLTKPVDSRKLSETVARYVGSKVHHVRYSTASDAAGRSGPV